MLSTDAVGLRGPPPLLEKHVCLPVLWTGEGGAGGVNRDAACSAHAHQPGQLQKSRRSAREHWRWMSRAHLLGWTKISDIVT